MIRKAIFQVNDNSETHSNAVDTKNDYEAVWEIFH
jgi:hypothetical protein